MINLLKETKSAFLPLDLKKIAGEQDETHYKFDPNLNLIEQQTKLRVFTTIIMEACYDDWIREISNSNFSYAASQIEISTDVIKKQLISALGENPQAKEMGNINTNLANINKIITNIYTKTATAANIQGHDQFFSELEKLMNGIIQEKLNANPVINSQLQLLTHLYGLDAKPKTHMTNRLEDGLATFIKELNGAFAKIRKTYTSREQFLENYKKTTELKELLIKSQLNLETIKLTTFGTPTEVQISSGINRIKGQAKLTPNIGNTTHSGCPINHLNSNRTLAKLIETIASQYAMKLLKSEKTC
jgi:hypothetical protein